MRKSILDTYNGPAKMPNLEELTKNSMVYENAISPAPWTYPSHVSIFTGLYPSEHNVHETFEAKLYDLNKFHQALQAERLSEYFHSLGYTTEGISNNIMVSPQMLFDRGFDSFYMIDYARPLIRESKIIKEVRGLGKSPKEVFFKLLKKGRIIDISRFYLYFRYLKKMDKLYNFPMDKGGTLTNNLLSYSMWHEKSFKFINFMEMHEPYETVSHGDEIFKNYTGIKKISQKRADYLKEKYIKEAQYLDSQIGSLIKTLKSSGFYDDTMIIITADHGQAFNEHGHMYHDTFLYDEIIRVPLIIKYPNSKKFDKKEGYQSTTNIFKLIKSVLGGGDDSALITESAFSESYGTTIVLPDKYADTADFVKNKYEKARKAVFKNGFKLNVNGTDGIIEEFTKDGKDVDPKEYEKEFKDLVNELEIFAGSETFKLPAL
jgi:arylsulfatase A-like enzyme